MTNEQAKKMLKAKLECLNRETSGTDFDCNNSNCDECSLCYEQGNMGEQKEALDMAIKALEQQPCEDTISRQAAIDATWFEPSYTDPLNVLTEVRDRLKALPSAQPERKNGKWIDYSDEGYVECPFCHSATNCDGNKDELHFCFSCGADLRCEQDDSISS